MGWLTNIGKAVGTVASPLAKLGKLPGVGMIPVVGNVLSAVGAASTVYGAAKALGVGGGSNSGTPGGLPALPGTTGGFGIPRGPDGKMQMPWNDPSTPANAKPWALDDSYLRTYFKAPRGYVVMWDGGAHGVGRPFPVLKSHARTLRYANGQKVFHQHAKPPISVGEYHSLKRAHRTIKKVTKIHGLISYVHNHTTTAGKVKIAHHKKGGHK